MGYPCPMQLQLGCWARNIKGIWRILVVGSHTGGTFKANAMDEGVFVPDESFSKRVWRDLP